MNSGKLAFALLLVIASSCSKSSSSGNNNSIEGKWKLIESLADPGDGSGKWQPADPSHPLYIDFTPDGRLVSTSGFSGYDRYQLNADSTRIILKKSTGTEQLEVFYTLENPILTINPPCIEPCGLRYTRVKK